ncbi:MAG TPA: hypothetical protein VI007_08405 [bacterium]
MKIIVQHGEVAEIGAILADLFVELPPECLDGTLSEFDRPAQRAIERLVLGRVVAIRDEDPTAVAEGTDR